MHNRLATDETNYIYTLQFFQNDINGYSYAFQDRRKFKDVEDALKTTAQNGYEDDKEQGYARDATRAAMNLMLMLVHYGHKGGGPLHPGEYAKHRSKKALQHFAIADFSTVQMVQNVVIRRVQNKPDHEPIPSGREMAPHWRRSHWRNQPHGPGAQLRKMVFINPVLIRADRAVGDLAESRALYHV